MRLRLVMALMNTLGRLPWEWVLSSPIKNYGSLHARNRYPPRTSLLRHKELQTTGRQETAKTMRRMTNFG